MSHSHSISVYFATNQSTVMSLNTFFVFFLLHQVTVAHINATAKNAADDKLRQSLRRFAETHTAPATVVLVSCKFISGSLKIIAALVPPRILLQVFFVFYC